MKIEQIKVADIIPYKENAKKHDKVQIDNVAESIRQFGFAQPLVIDKQNNLIIGHCRLLAAKKLHLRQVPVVRMDELTDDQVKKLRLLDNKLNESDWDFELLSGELFELDFDGFNIDWGLPLDIDDDGEIIEDDVPDDVATRCKRGDVWLLGEHRLICGDCTDAATLATLMQGQKADMIFTDPPYNVDYAAKNKFLNNLEGNPSRGHRIQTDIINDTFENDQDASNKLWQPAFENMRQFANDCCSIYVTMPQGITHLAMTDAVTKSGWQAKHELIWVKNRHVLGRVDYYYKHEPILYGWNKTHKFYGKGKHNKSTWEIPSPEKSKLHPTMKPIELVANAIMNSTTKGQIILDCFGGSGSSLIACEQTGRRCRMVELDEHYCDVIIQRWENLTRQKAVKADE